MNETSSTRRISSVPNVFGDGGRTDENDEVMESCLPCPGLHMV